MIVGENSTRCKKMIPIYSFVKAVVELFYFFLLKFACVPSKKKVNNVKDMLRINKRLHSDKKMQLWIVVVVWGNIMLLKNIVLSIVS